MILLADSGSTKAHWCFVENGIIKKEIITQGINPFYQTPEEIEQEISKIHQVESGSDPQEIFFYGAGCLPETAEKIKKAIYHFFPARIEVNSDLLAACRALSSNQGGIVGILGTGSNSCLYDGRNITGHVSPLGYILGDEGSGAALGKQLVADMLKNRFSPLLKEKFFARFELTPAIIMERVYRSTFPNRFLAGLSLFINENRVEFPELQPIAEQSFSAFFERNILQYGNTGLPVHFSGSIAYHYKDILNKITTKYDRQLGKVEMYPMNSLVKYHSGCY
ncbi:MAG: ATPase [Bacteroidales bacterium]|jgi:N-acetylglucosamine kinase-like BadF-type ATPase|nr:ATPase [Bacteroidales bacterium]